MMTSGAAAGRARERGKILVVMDGSKKALKQGITLAQEEKARITVLKMLRFWERDIYPAGARDLHAALGDGFPLSADIADKIRVLSGYSTDSILEAADEEQYDLIVMGTRRKKGILGRIFGDYRVRKVINTVTCPVYVVGSACEEVPEYAPHLERVTSYTFN